MVLKLRMLWKDSFIQKIRDDRMNVLMIIFLGLDQKVAIEREYVTNLIKIFILYLHMKTDRIKLMEFLMENS
jgi:hypothetical protein